MGNAMRASAGVAGRGAAGFSSAAASAGGGFGLIGETPLVDLSRFSRTHGVRILAKAEFVNPSGSIKDRIAKHIIALAEQRGALKAGSTVVASTSGNTGAAVAMVAAMRGYKYIVITNAKCSEEKRDSMRAYGGQVIVAKDGLPADHPEHYVNLEATLVERHKGEGYFGVDQYENLDNPEAYYQTLGPEIWRQTEGAVTHFVAGGSTGGTVSGTGRYLKDKSGGKVRVLLPDPVGSVLLGAFHNPGSDQAEGAPQGGKPHAPLEEGVLAAGKYAVEGVGKDSVPGTMAFEHVDAVLSVTDKQAVDMCLRMAHEEGVLAGGSSGLNVHGAVELSARVPAGSVIVTVLPDTGLKYLSKIYNKEWRESKGLDGGPAGTAAAAADKQAGASAARQAAGFKLAGAPQDTDPLAPLLK